MYLGELINLDGGLEHGDRTRANWRRGDRRYHWEQMADRRANTLISTLLWHILAAKQL